MSFDYLGRSRRVELFVSVFCALFSLSRSNFRKEIYEKYRILCRSILAVWFLTSFHDFNMRRLQFYGSVIKGGNSCGIEVAVVAIETMDTINSLWITKSCRWQKSLGVRMWYRCRTQFSIKWLQHIHHIDIPSTTKCKNPSIKYSQK